jgi:hypothetical protein
MASLPVTEVTRLRTQSQNSPQDAPVKHEMVKKERNSWIKIQTSTAVAISSGASRAVASHFLIFFRYCWSISSNISTNSASRDLQSKYEPDTTANMQIYNISYKVRPYLLVDGRKKSVIRVCFDMGFKPQKF